VCAQVIERSVELSLITHFHSDHYSRHRSNRSPVSACVLKGRNRGQRFLRTVKPCEKNGEIQRMAYAVPCCVLHRPSEDLERLFIASQRTQRTRAHVENPRNLPLQIFIRWGFRRGPLLSVQHRIGKLQNFVIAMKQHQSVGDPNELAEIARRLPGCVLTPLELVLRSLEDVSFYEFGPFDVDVAIVSLQPNQNVRIRDVRRNRKGFIPSVLSQKVQT